jgi:hypothetical protein
MPDTPVHDPFSDENPPGEPPLQIKRDQYGRYLLPNPDTGKRQAWTRVTTFAKAVADTYNLNLYENRLVAKGMSLRPDLYAEAAGTHEEDKTALNTIAETAMEAAGKSKKSRLGTALHTFTEKVDLKQKVTVPEPWDADVKAYVEIVKEAGLKIDPKFVETVVVVPELGVAGTLDRLGFFPPWGEDHIVADLKTGHSVQYAWMEIACQLFAYSRATHYYDLETEELVEMPPINPDKAMVMHLPVGLADPKLYEIDLAFGGEVAQASKKVRELRSRKGYVQALDFSIEETVEEAPAISGDDDWDDEPAKKPKTKSTTATGKAKNAADPGKYLESGHLSDFDDEQWPEEWLAAGLDPSWTTQPVKVGESKTARYLAVNTGSGDWWSYKLRRDAKAKLELILQDPEAKAEVEAVRDGEPESDDDWDAEAKASGPWSDVPLAPAPSDDEWDVEAAGPPPGPDVKALQSDLEELRETQAAKNAPAEVPLDVDGVIKTKASLLAAVLEAATEQKLSDLWKDYKNTLWSDRHTRAAVSRKAEILTAEVALIDDDDDWD